MIEPDLTAGNESSNRWRCRGGDKGGGYYLSHLYESSYVQEKRGIKAKINEKQKKGANQHEI